MSAACRAPRRSTAASPRVVPSVASLACAAAFALSSCGPASSAPTGPAAPPDVLLISLDTVRADALTFLDARAAPRLAELAQRGVVFRQAIAGSSWTLPTHAEMFTGQPPVVHGVRTDSVRLDPAVPTLPEALRDAGYWTAGLYTNWFVAGPYGFSRGFGAYVNAMTDGEALAARLDEALAAGDTDGALAAIRDRDVKVHADVTSARVVDRALELLAGAPDGPRFLFAHLMDPHADFVPPPPFDTRFDPDYDGPVDGRDLAGDRTLFDPTRRPARQVGERDLVHLRALYAGEIAWTDSQVGRLLDALAAEGRLERTLVIVTADHGEEFFEHDGFGHRASVHDEVLRVPLLIVPPGGRPAGAPATVDAQVSLSDLMPTVLDYVGRPAPPSVIGRSLRPLAEGRALPPRPLVASLLQVGRADAGGRTDRVFEALRDEGRKFVRVLELPPDGAPRVLDVRLYDLSADPGEQRPRRDPADPAVRAAWMELEATLDALRARWRALPPSPADARGTPVARLFESDLAALGYTGPVVHPWQPRLLGPLPPLPPPDALEDPSVR